jgi:hypothetical protein
VHLAGNGSRLVSAARHGGVQIVATWPGTRNDERKLKKRHNARGLCPLCKAELREEARLRMRRLRAAKKQRAAAFEKWVTA